MAKSHSSFNNVNRQSEKTVSVLENNFKLFSNISFVEWVSSTSTKKHKDYPSLIRYWGWSIKIAKTHLDKNGEGRNKLTEFFNLLENYDGSVNYDNLTTVNTEMQKLTLGLIPCSWNKLNNSDKKIILRYVQMVYSGVEPTWLVAKHKGYLDVFANTESFPKLNTGAVVGNTVVIFKPKRKVVNHA